MTRREITVYDGATDTETTVVIERDGTREPRILAVSLAVRDTDGPGLSAEHLFMLEELGLPLPRGPHHDDDEPDALPATLPIPQASEARTMRLSQAPRKPTDEQPTAPQQAPELSEQRDFLARLAPQSDEAPTPAFDQQTIVQPWDTPPSPKATPPKKAPSKKAPTSTVKRRNTYRRRPASAVLVAAYEKAKGSPKAMAAMFDVPTYTMQSWLASARKDGILPMSSKNATIKTEDGS